MPTKNELKLLHALQQKKQRQLHRLFMVEGTKSVKELLQSDFEIQGIYATEQWQIQHPDISIPHIQSISEKEAAYISNWQTSPGIMACARFRDNTPIDYEQLSDRILVLDGIQDTGNFGTQIRTADWFGIKMIVCSPQTVEMYNPKCIQASMGSFTRVQIEYCQLPVFLQNIRKSHRIFGACMEGTSLQEKNFPSHSALVIGSEAHGISPEVEQLLDEKITIPQKASHAADSLNAAIATAIFCYEMTKK